jgi:hypothetical protein
MGVSCVLVAASRSLATTTLDPVYRVVGWLGVGLFVLCGGIAEIVDLGMLIADALDERDPNALGYQVTDAELDALSCPICLPAWRVRGA